MFENPKDLAVESLKAHAAKLNLNTAAFNSCLDSSKYTNAIQKDIQEGVRAGVSGTPAIFINGRFLSGAQPFEEIAKIIDDELKGK